MNIRFHIITILLICINLNSFSQEKKIAVAKRVSTAPIIDGVLNDNVWATAEINTDFYMLRPSNVGPARSSHPTTVKIIYDDEAVYFAASMLDPDAKNIPSEISQRD